MNRDVFTTKIIFIETPDLAQNFIKQVLKLNFNFFFIWKKFKIKKILSQVLAFYDLRNGRYLHFFSP